MNGLEYIPQIAIAPVSPRLLAIAPAHPCARKFSASMHVNDYIALFSS